MLLLKEITQQNADSICRLSVQEAQQNFVASNKTSLMEAKDALSGGGQAFPFGIYEGDLPVGFLMVGFGTDEHWENPPAIAQNNYNIWRLMIDAHYQGKGYGRQALQLALSFIRQWPCGKAEHCWLSYHPENSTARNLYQSFGFHETDQKDGDEIIAVLKL